MYPLGQDAKKSDDTPEKCRQLGLDVPEITDPVRDSSESAVLAESDDTREPHDFSTTTQTGIADEAPLPFDLETFSASDLFRSDVGGFVRLCGAGEAIGPSPETVLNHPGPLVAHNGFGFDYQVLAQHHGFDLLQAGEEGRLIDTMVLAELEHPPAGGSNGKQSLRMWSLDNLGQELLGAGTADSLKALAKKHGGFDRIPAADPDFVAYCQRDTEMVGQLLEHFCPGGELTEYQRREMRLHSRLVAGITMQGFRVDVELLQQRIAEGQRQKDEGQQLLVERYGLPTTTKDGKRAAKSPANTEAGKAAIAQAFADLGVQLPTTKTGRPSTSSDAMQNLIDSPDSSAEVVRLAEVVLKINGVRTIYQTLADGLVGDRIHPQLSACQASGRFSVTPGMTTFGKRGGKVIEREVFLPDSPDHCLIACDLSQIDARAVAAHSQDPAYLDMFELGEEGKPRDIHTEVALAIWGDASRRSDAKPINHGINYGMSARRLSQATGQDEFEAQKILAKFWRRFPKLRSWQESVRTKGEQGLPLANGFGRFHRVDQERAYTQSPALIGQGCARDLMMEGILRLPIEVVPMLRMLVHDELVFSVPKDRADDIEAQILDALQFEWSPHEGARPIQVLADLGCRGDNWAEVYAKD